MNLCVVDRTSPWSDRQTGFFGDGGRHRQCSAHASRVNPSWVTSSVIHA
ncbi:hypothetical protein SBD_3194 [Streptomyces bottropensis ATCC 25435]|uniref:Uncharacterized protein n=1 Tax=Streptomyces bottropensis ATCC 25435 TaxID=1054862 RepID=M3EHU1_9ACTN|nr:hypothetical protein SBD_3194 [Streptomyces bottropensis ATCC 25435]